MSTFFSSPKKSKKPQNLPRHLYLRTLSVSHTGRYPCPRVHFFQKHCCSKQYEALRDELSALVVDRERGVVNQHMLTPRTKCPQESMMALGPGGSGDWDIFTSRNRTQMVITLRNDQIKTNQKKSNYKCKPESKVNDVTRVTRYGCRLILHNYKWGPVIWW